MSRQPNQHTRRLDGKGALASMTLLAFIFLVMAAAILLLLGLFLMGA